MATAFLSCSVRPQDRPLVDAVRQKARELGFDTKTIGIGQSRPSQPDDAMRQLMGECDCLIGLATERFEAVDVHDLAKRKVMLATSYLTQEAAMAFQRGMPMVILTTPQIDLQAVTRRNLYHVVSAQLSPTGRLRLQNRAAFESAMASLRGEAVAFRDARQRETLWGGVRTAVTWGTATFLGVKMLDSLSKPDCFGQFYYLDPECKACEHKPACKVRKAELQS